MAESTNIFFIKTFSPFARSYSPALGQLLNPIHQEEFLAFIDGLNRAFLSAPAFQAMHIAGGMMLSAQGVIPVQAVGAVFQIGSIATTAVVSMMRVKKFLKKANAEMFGPRGLSCRIMSTKKMMQAVGASETNAKGKQVPLKLPALNDISDLHLYESMASQQTGLEDLTPSGAEDPRMRRLRALSAYVSPLTFDVPEDTRKRNWFVQKTEAPLKWLGNKQLHKIDKTREKTLAKREEKAPEVEAEVLKAQAGIESIELKLAALHERTNSQLATLKGTEEERTKIAHDADEQMHELELQRATQMQARDQAIAAIYSKGDKKLHKAYRQEEKIANRILWVVIESGDGSGGELVHMDSDSATTTTTRGEH